MDFPLRRVLSSLQSVGLADVEVGDHRRADSFDRPNVCDCTAPAIPAGRIEADADDLDRGDGPSASVFISHSIKKRGQVGKQVTSYSQRAKALITMCVITEIGAFRRHT
jgi:hypothetical protein